MADLKTNYVDDKLNASANQLRKYQQIKNDDGTVSFVDVTDYTETGTSFGANDINATNKAINKNTTDINSLNLKFDGLNQSMKQIITTEECIVKTKENAFVNINDSTIINGGKYPLNKNAIPMVIGLNKTSNCLINIHFTDGAWRIYTNVEQQVTIKWYKILS